MHKDKPTYPGGSQASSGGTTVELTSAPETAFVEGFITKGPGALYIELPDRVFVQTRLLGQGTAVLSLRGRIMRVDGQVIVFQFPVNVPQSNFFNFAFDLAEGYLLDLTLQDVAADKPGTVWVQAGIGRGTLTNFDMGAVLISGSLVGTSWLAWPYSNPRPLTDGQGLFFHQAQANPAAGADFTYTVPTTVTGRLKSVFFTFVTSAAAATRGVRIVIQDDLGDVLVRSAANITQVASLTQFYNGGHFPFASTAIVGEAYIPLPNDFLMQGNWTISSLTNNIQAADQYSTIQIAYEAWNCARQ